MSVTIKDIAKIANVNPSTVSRSLNDSPLIPKETRDRIKKIADDLNFEFNTNARSLITKKTNIIGVIVLETDEHEPSFSYFLAQLEYHIRSYLEKLSYDAIITASKNINTGESNLKKILNQKKFDGLLIVHYDIDKYLLDKIEKSQFPSVFLHFKLNNHDIRKLNYVIPDNEKGGYLATNYLLKLGFKNIMTLTFSYVRDVQFIERTEGYKRALREAGLNGNYEHIFTIKSSYQSGYNFIIENASSLKNYDAVFAQSDVAAIGVINALTELGIKVPDDISVIGYSDLEISNYVRPKLTTIHQPLEELAEIGCKKIVDILTGENSEKLLQKVLDPTIVMRESCKIL